MKLWIAGLACVVLLVLTVGVYPDTPASQSAAASGVIVRLHNGSVMQPAVLLEALEIDTKLGKLSIPAAEVRRIDFAFRLADDDAKTLDQALRDLGNAKFQLRNVARKQLLSMGRLAYPGLRELQKTSDLEVARQVEGILKEIRSRIPAERLKFRSTDLVRTSDSTVAGKICSQSLRFRCEVFGDIKVPVHHLRDLRSLLSKDELNVAVDSNQYGNRLTWFDTGMELSSDVRVVITAGGEINLGLDNPNARNVRPSGTTGLVSGEAFVPGQLVGRIGADGPSFVVGSHYSGVPDRQGKLFLRIVTIEHANNIKATGSYQVRIVAEPN